MESVMTHELYVLVSKTFRKLTIRSTGWGRSLAFMAYGSWWRKHRRLFHQYFRPQAVTAYRPMMKKGILTGLDLLFESPDLFFKQKTAYEILRSDWSSDVCSSDLPIL